MAIKQSSTVAIQTATTDKAKVIKIIAWVVLGLLVSASGILYEFYPETFTAIKEYATSQWVTYSAILLTIASSTGSIAGIRLGQIFYDARAVKSAMAIDNARIEAIENKNKLYETLFEGVVVYLNKVNAKDANKVRREDGVAFLDKLNNALSLVKQYDISKLSKEEIQKSLVKVDNVVDTVKATINIK